MYKIYQFQNQNIPDRAMSFICQLFGLLLTKKRCQISLPPIQFIKHHGKYTLSPGVVPYTMLYA